MTVMPLLLPIPANAGLQREKVERSVLVGTPSKVKAGLFILGTIQT